MKKNTLLTAVVLTLISSVYMYAQDVLVISSDDPLQLNALPTTGNTDPGWCGTPYDAPDFLKSINPTTGGRGGDPWVLRIAVHVVRNSDGSGGQTCEEVETAMAILTEDFEPANIKFDLIYTDEILNSNYMDYFSNLEFDELMNLYNHANVIDIFLLGNDTRFGSQNQSAPYKGQAADIPGTAFIIGGKYDNNTYSYFRDHYNLVTSHAISHEMGHCLGLYHTFHGMVQCESDVNTCPELVDNQFIEPGQTVQNGVRCGDFVMSTPADPTSREVKLNYGANGDYCHLSSPWEFNCVADGIFSDVRGQTYDPPINNYMSYIEWGCMEEFTAGQVIRMSDYIENHPALQQVVSERVDLASYDGGCGDLGQDGSLLEVMWESPDIWVRNQTDGFDPANQVHETVEYDAINHPYVYVRVTNRGTLTSAPTGNHLALYWAKANGNFPFPDVWSGSVLYDAFAPDGTPLSPLPAGGLIGVKQDLPSISPGASRIVRLEWFNVPNPNLYSNVSSENIGNDVQHTCILSYIVSGEDPLLFLDGSQIGRFVTKNNNVAWKNVAVFDNNSINGTNPISDVDDIFDPEGDGVYTPIVGGIIDKIMNQLSTCVVVGNVASQPTQPSQPNTQPITSDIVYEIESKDGTKLTDLADVHIALNENLFNAWKKSGSQSTGLEAMKSIPSMAAQGIVHNNSPLFQGRSAKEWFDLEGERAVLSDVVFAPDQLGNACFAVTFQGKVAFDDDNFKLRIIQKDAATGKNMGGFTYTIQTPDCPGIIIAEDEIKLGSSQEITLNASVLTNKEDILFVWTDDMGKIVGVGDQVTITPKKSTLYHLETMSRTGCIAENFVNVIIDKRYLYRIDKVTPNPVKNNIMVVDYNAEEAVSASLEIMKLDGTASQDVLLDPAQKQKTVNIGQLPIGLYKIRLKCNGTEVDTKNFMKQ